MKLSKVFLLLYPAIFSGCTNVAGDVARTLEPLSADPLNRAALLSSANAFFTDAGYQCRSASDTEDFRSIFTRPTRWWRFSRVMMGEILCW
jgi:hypothetical protein